MTKESTLRILIWVLAGILLVSAIAAIIILGGKKKPYCGKGHEKKGECVCPLGYTGENCASCAPGYQYNPITKLCSEPAEKTKKCPTDCGEHGKCNTTTNKCDCTPPWSGDNCNTPNCPDGCGASLKPPHGKCNANTGVCDCNKGWGISTGNCGDKISTYGCNPKTGCDPTLKGGDQTYASCDSACKKCGNDGCVSPTDYCEPFCACKTGWSGERCGTKDTDWACSPLGKCVEGPGGTLTFDACANTCKKCPDCGSHGKCNTAKGKCACDEGWSGDSCLTFCPNSCFADNNPPQGTCDPTTKRCICENGWALSANGDCSELISTYGCNPDTGCDEKFPGGAMTLAACNADSGCKKCMTEGCFNQNKWCDTSPQA